MHVAVGSSLTRGIDRAIERYRRLDEFSAEAHTAQVAELGSHLLRAKRPGRCLARRPVDRPRRTFTRFFHGHIPAGAPASSLGKMWSTGGSVGFCGLSLELHVRRHEL